MADNTQGGSVHHFGTPPAAEKRRRNWALWVLPLLYLAILLGAAFVGVVKFMAWWRVAFGACHP